MKITPAMIEAGVAAMARAKRGRTVQDPELVTLVYTAMENRKAVESREPKPTAKPYEHQDWPAWFHGPTGGSRIFNSAVEVPEGWTAVPQTPAAAEMSYVTPDIIEKRKPGRPKKEATA